MEAQIARGGGIVRIDAPAHAPYRNPILIWGGADVQLLGWDAKPWYVQPSVRHTGGFQTMGGGVYRKAAGASEDLGVVWDESLPNAQGRPTALYRAKTDSAQPAAGRFALFGGYLYLRLPGDVSPNGHAIEVAKAKAAISVANGSGSHVVVEHARLRGGTYAGLDVGTLAVGANLYVRLTSSEYATNGFAARGAYSESTFRDCETRYNSNDGFNIHGRGSVASTMVLTDCLSEWNLDEGASPHDNTRLIVRRGTYRDNGEAGFHAINTATMELTNVVVQRNSRNRTMGYYGGIDFNNDTRGKIQGCTIEGNFGPGFWRLKPVNVRVSDTVSRGNSQADR
ncbi:right-handed parallel beta-helix repeat-containing protein [bacterium]|nr:MAG: right-handed parallel beta-helix repeat-containing protein [bacterium]